MVNLLIHQANKEPFKASQFVIQRNLHKEVKLLIQQAETHEAGYSGNPIDKERAS